MPLYKFEYILEIDSVRQFTIERQGGKLGYEKVARLDFRTYRIPRTGQPVACSWTIELTEYVCSPAYWMFGGAQHSPQQVAMAIMNQKGVRPTHCNDAKREIDLMVEKMRPFQTDHTEITLASIQVSVSIFLKTAGSVGYVKNSVFYLEVPDSYSICGGGYWGGLKAIASINLDSD